MTFRQGAQRGRNPTRSEYMRRILKMHKGGRFKPGTVKHVFVYHDDHCAFFRGGYCDCDPAIKVKDAAGHAGKAT